MADSAENTASLVPVVLLCEPARAFGAEENAAKEENWWKGLHRQGNNPGRVALNNVNSEAGMLLSGGHTLRCSKLP